MATAASGEVAPATTTARTNATLEALKNPSGAVQYDETNHSRYPAGDPSKRAFTYFVLSGGRFIYASAIRLAVLKFVLSMTVRISAPGFRCCSNPAQSLMISLRAVLCIHRQVRT